MTKLLTRFFPRFFATEDDVHGFYSSCIALVFGLIVAVPTYLFLNAWVKAKANRESNEGQAKAEAAKTVVGTFPDGVVRRVVVNGKTYLVAERKGGVAVVEVVEERP